MLLAWGLGCLLRCCSLRVLGYRLALLGVSMALLLKLPNNFHMCTFGSNRNTSSLGKEMMPNVARNAIVGMEIIHISETHFLQAMSCSAPHDYVTLKVTVVSLMADLVSEREGPSVGKTTHTVARMGRMKRKTSPSIIKCCW